MVKQFGTNKSEEIRHMLRDNPETQPKLIVSGLAERGIKVKLSQVYSVRGAMRERAKQGRREKIRNEKVVQAAGSASNGDAVSLILKIKDLASSVGGMDKLKAVVDAMSE